FHEFGKTAPHLRVLPWAETIVADQHGGRPGGLDDLLKRLLPGPARDQLPLIQPDFQPSSTQRLGECADGGLVLAVVAQEDVEALSHSRRDSSADPGGLRGRPDTGPPGVQSSYRRWQHWRSQRAVSIPGPVTAWGSVADQATSRGASSSARTWQSMRRAEVLRNRPQTRRTREKRGWLSPRSGPLVSPRKTPKGPETMPATGKGTILDSPGRRMGTWKVALVQVLDHHAPVSSPANSKTSARVEASSRKPRASRRAR